MHIKKGVTFYGYSRRIKSALYDIETSSVYSVNCRHMEIKPKKYSVCRLEKLIEKRCYGCEITHEGKLNSYFLVYHNNKIYSYLNRCPHTGVNLDWIPHQFLDSNNELIQCATHGALFNIEEGLCLRGPCVGDKLQSIENMIIDNSIYLIL